MLLRHLRVLACACSIAVAFVAAADPSPGASYALIAYPGGSTNTGVFGVNDFGQAVGTGWDSNGNFLASFVYDLRRAKFTILPPIPDPNFGELDPIGINDAGTVVGAAYSPDYTSVSAFILDRSGHYTTFTHPGSQVAYCGTLARSMSNTGIVAGEACTADGQSTLGFLYDPGSRQFIDIAPANSFESFAAGVNSWGWAVGMAAYDADAFYAGSPFGAYGWLRTPDGRITLFRVNGYGTQPRGLNDLGQITGFVRIDACGLCQKAFVITVDQVIGSGKHARGFVNVTVPGAALFVPPAEYEANGESINNWGVVVGNTDDGNFGYGFVRWPSH